MTRKYEDEEDDMCSCGDCVYNRSLGKGYKCLCCEKWFCDNCGQNKFLEIPNPNYNEEDSEDSSMEYEEGNNCRKI